MAALHTPPPERARCMVAYTGLLCALCGLLLLASLATLAFYPREAGFAPAFLIPGGVGLLLGIGLWRLARPPSRPALSLQDAGVVVVAGWIVSCVLAALPLIWVSGLSFTQAILNPSAASPQPASRSWTSPRLPISFSFGAA